MAAVAAVLLSPSCLSSSLSIAAGESSRLLSSFLPISHSVCVGLTKPISPLIIRASSSSASSSSSSSTQFNITFGHGSSKAPQNDAPTAPMQANPFLIPWIIRDENGNLKLQTTPPAHILNAMAAAETTTKKKTPRKEKPASKAAASSSEPKHSKAARRFYNENFREPQRLSKVLAAAGVASRRGSEELIFDGRVTVNGSVCKSPQTRVDHFRDVIYVNGNRLAKKLPPKLYFAVNKPKGYICSSGEKESKLVLSLFDEYWKSWAKTNPGTPKPRLFTVGRLDVATTGLLIVTNDGDFAQTLTHPSSQLTKEYIAAIEGNVNKRHLQAISEGTVIDGIHCRPDSVELLPAQPHNSRPRVRIVVHEGRNHEVRELVKSAGLKLYSLKRVRIGGFRLPPDLG
ncbi:putative ribosomal large subunit pseudouridine synthase SVR1, chloroplastic isoform X2 [Nymphaea colorata]|nr:putative ribosomal large subunit pseudouridine synthase SVR1, chloroplastic isoform X2 [Nymphaea colorata]